MRLIDADKMKLEVNSENPIVIYYSKEIEEWRDSQPTVKAIPIEWLCRKYLDINKKSWSAVTCLIVNKIIHTWEKEKCR